MKHWVYIYKDEKDNFKIALTISDDNIISNKKLKAPIVYLRPFEIPFDAIAHKHLLDDLSIQSVLNWIDKHKEETKVWLRITS